MPTKTKAKTDAEPAFIEELDTEKLDSIDSAEVADSADDFGDDEDDAEPSETEETERHERLAGKALLDFYNEKKAAGRNHYQIAYDAGYLTITKSGQERVMKAPFDKALLQAQGIDTGSQSGPGRSHAGLTQARCSGQGILLVSQLATRHIGANPGDVFEVSYPGNGQILLRPTGEVKPVIPRKRSEEQPGTPLLDGETV